MTHKGKLYVEIVSGFMGKSLEESSRGGEPERIGDNTEEGRNRKLMSWLLLAHEVLANLNHYRPPPFPERPADLPEEDTVIEASLRIMRDKRPGTSPRSEVQLVKTFTRWREDIAAKEAQSQSNLALLMNMHRVFDRVGDEQSQDCRTHLENHIHHHWKIRPPFPEDEADRERLVQKACRRSDLLATWLLAGDRPPRSQYNPSAERTAVERMMDPDDFDDGET